MVIRPSIYAAHFFLSQLYFLVSVPAWISGYFVSHSFLYFTICPAWSVALVYLYRFPFWITLTNSSFIHSFNQHMLRLYFTLKTCSRTSSCRSSRRKFASTNVGDGVQPWSRKISMPWATKLMRDTPLSLCSRAGAPKQEKPLVMRSRAPQWSAARLLQLGEAHATETKDSVQLKKYIINFFNVLFKIYYCRNHCYSLK